MAETAISTSAPQSRFAFPYPTRTQDELRKAIVFLMLDGQRRSVHEIQQALGTEKEVGARIRELRAGTYGTKWPFTDARAEGPDSDRVFRYRLRVEELPMEMRRRQ